MIKLVSYLKEHARITLASIKTPRKFFEEVKHEDENKSFAYLLISNMIFIAGILLGLLFLWGVPPFLIEVIYLLVIITTLYIILAILLSTICSAVLHLAVILVKGKGRFYQTFKVICYAASPLNIAWFFVVTILIAEFSLGFSRGLSAVILPLLSLLVSLLYAYYIIVVGISVTSDISGSRAFAALMIPLFIFVFTPIILAYAPVFFQQYDASTTPAYSPIPSPIPAHENYRQPNPEKYRITTYVGSPPQIDGAVTEEDKWYEGETLKVEVKAGFHDPVTYNITTKHDFEYIYILMEWGIYAEGGNNIAISFDQDEGKPDFNLSSGRADRYYQGYYKDNHFVISDTHYDSDDAEYSDKEHQNGSLKGGYRNGKWTLEWKIPMNSGDKYDINIDKYPTEIGFSIIDTITTPGGIFPPDANKHDPRTWGTMTIVDKRRQ